MTHQCMFDQSQLSCFDHRDQHNCFFCHYCENVKSRSFQISLQMGGLGHGHGHLHENITIDWDSIKWDELTPEEKWNYEHLKMHQKHAGHAEMHAEMVLILLVVLVITFNLLHIILIFSIKNTLIKDMSPWGLELMTFSSQAQDLVSELPRH